MSGLFLPALILSALVYCLGRRSGRPMMLAVFHFLLAHAIAAGFVGLGVLGFDVVDPLLGEPQQGDAFGFGRLGLYFLVVVLLGNLVSLVIVLAVGARMAHRRGSSWVEFERLVRRARAICGDRISTSEEGFDDSDLDESLRTGKDALALDEVESISYDNPVSREFWMLLLQAAKLRGLEVHIRHYEHILSLGSRNDSH